MQGLISSSRNDQEFLAALKGIARGLRPKEQKIVYIDLWGTEGRNKLEGHLTLGWKIKFMDRNTAKGGITSEHIIILERTKP